MAARKKGSRKGTRTRKAGRSGNPGGTARAPRANKKGSTGQPPSVPPGPSASALPSEAPGRGGARPARRGPPPFPIVGIGGSAGALGPIQEILRGLPRDCGLAVVVVSHQAPHAASLLKEILSRCTEMPVANVSGTERVQPNRVYVAPPGVLLGIRDGVLHVGGEIERGHLPLPIDTFFRALAADQGHGAVGVLVSGTGTDGTLGLGAIREATGLTLVQDPLTAEFGGMPGTAIDALAADLVLSVEEIPAHLMDYARAIARELPPTPKATSSSELEQIVALIRSRARRDFSAYKPGTLQRRIRRRMDLRGVASLQHYVRYLEENAEEVDALWRDWLIGVSGFFRDPQAFQALGEVALPQLLMGHRGKEPLRIWVPGCATGEEAYSIAMVVFETLERIGRQMEVQIFATDLDPAAIQVARIGRYPEGIAADVGPERLQRFFSREERRLRVKPVLRDMIVFAVQNVLQDPPFSRMDVISCRNVLMYLTTPAQRSLVPIFYYSLKPGGLLILGASESLAGFDEAFTPVEKRWKIFRRGESPPESLPGPWREQRRFGASVGLLEELRPMGQPPDLPAVMRRRLANHFAPPSVLVDAHGHIHQVHGQVGPYLTVAPGRASLNVVEMAREGVRAPLISALREVQGKKREITEKSARVKTTRRWRQVRLRVEKVDEPRVGRPMALISFEPIPEAPKAKGTGRGAAAPESRKEVLQLRRELVNTQDALHGTIEELQASNEALASANEEVQSMNEELQSANEELQTSKEETQSLNEELQTLNEDLTRKLELLEQANDDLQNVINSTRIATIFLDHRLRVKRFTPETRRLIRLVESDVGRSLADLNTSLEYPQLMENARTVLETLNPIARDVRASSGSWYTVTISPYRNSREVIQGLVLTFTDISPVKRAEREAQAARGLAEGIVATVREPLLVLDGDLRVTETNRAFCEAFGLAPAEAMGRLVYDLGGGQWDIPELRQLLERILPEDTSFEHFEVLSNFAPVGRKRLLLNARRIRSETEDLPERILMAFQEVPEGAGSSPSASAEPRDEEP